MKILSVLLSIGFASLAFADTSFDFGDAGDDVYDDVTPYNPWYGYPGHPGYPGQNPGHPGYPGQNPGHPGYPGYNPCSVYGTRFEWGQVGHSQQCFLMESRYAPHLGGCEWNRVYVVEPRNCRRF